ncbi:hypothetical protein ACFWVP_33955 [Streptomyces sp. NPDC058637]|uniref:hypothetical protein n=1 Tax=Streptomyces sp. NPDC058637 TaxID=3346569 RepID=UPI00364E0FB5
MVPTAGVAVSLLTDGGGARGLYAALCRELHADLADVTTPAPFAPAAEPPTVDLARLLGTYGREGVVVTVAEQDGAGHAVYEFVDGTTDFSQPLDFDPLPVTESVFAGTGVGAAVSEDHTPVVFSTPRDGTGCVCIGMRRGPKVA